MSSQSLIILDQDNYRQYSMSISDVSMHSLWDHLRVLYPDIECYSTFKDYNAYVSNDHDTHPSINTTTTLPNERVGALSRIRVDLTYTNSVQRISEYRNKLYDPEAHLEKTTNPLPIAVRYINDDGDHYVEHYPFQAQVTFSDQRRKPYITEAQQIKIWIPWTMMRINLQNSSYQYMYAAGRSLMSMDDHYFVSPFPNTYPEGNICWSNSLIAYENMTYDYNLNGYNIDLKTFYSIAFNEYFSGGWNTDLSLLLVNTLDSQYHLFYKHFDQLPMIKTMMHPTTEYIQEHLPRLSAARRRMMSQGLQAQMNSRLKSTAYILYMMSTFTLEETLQFWNEIISLKDKFNSTTYSIKSFDELVAKDNQTHSLNSNSFYHDGITWSDLSTPVTQQDPLLVSQQQDIFNQNMYTYVYNISSTPSAASCLLRYFPSQLGDTQLFYTREIHNQMCVDFVNTGLNNLDHCHLYLVDHTNQSWTKMVIPNTEIQQHNQLPSVYQVDITVLHHALSRHRGLVPTEA